MNLTQPRPLGTSAVPLGDAGHEATEDMDLAALQELAQRHLGVERTASGLRTALAQLARWRVAGSDRASCERANLLALAKLIATAALNRENSLGAHYRADATAAPHTPQRASCPLRPTRRGHTNLNLRTKTLV